MEIKDLVLNNTVVGKYIEVDGINYELKLVSREMFGNQNSTVTDYIKKTPGAIAGINGGLFELFTNKIVGSYKDSSNNLEGTINSNGTYITYNNGKISANYIYSENEIMQYQWAVSSAYYCFLRDGNYVRDITLDYENQIDKKDTRTMIGQKINGNFILACTNISVSGEDQATILKNLGCIFGSNLDGGGSRQLISNGVSAINTGRAVPNAIIVVKKQLTPTFTGYYLNTFLQPVRIRESVVNGRELIMVPRGQQLRIIRFLPGFQSDGYQWAFVNHNGIRGYSQIDTKNWNTLSM